MILSLIVRELGVVNEAPPAILSGRMLPVSIKFLGLHSSTSFASRFFFGGFGVVVVDVVVGTSVVVLVVVFGVVLK